MAATRTLAFQIPEEMFNRIKAHLEAAERQAGEEAENAPCEAPALQQQYRQQTRGPRSIPSRMFRGPLFVFAKRR